MALIIAARRSPIASSNGVFKNLELEEICKPVINAAIQDSQISKSDIDCIILGNALGAGGNPARLCALSAGLPNTSAAITIDTQCCSGMDAIGIAAFKIKSGQANVVLAGGVESFSRAPLRARLNKKNKYVLYKQAKFSPWQKENLNIYNQTINIAKEMNISFEEQCQLAIESHRKAAAWNHPDIVSFNIDENKIDTDTFTRKLNLKTCIKANGKTNNLNPCLIANRADGAAIVVLASRKYINEKNIENFALEVKNWHQYGYDPIRPADIPKEFLEVKGVNASQFDQIEWMESFASQYLANECTFHLPKKRTNPYGGMIAMGHPIGASGAILISRLYHGMKKNSALGNQQSGLAVIPSAGGLVSAICASTLIS